MCRSRIIIDYVIFTIFVALTLNLYRESFDQAFPLISTKIQKINSVSYIIMIIVSPVRSTYGGYYGLVVVPPLDKTSSTSATASFSP